MTNEIKTSENKTQEWLENWVEEPTAKKETKKAVSYIRVATKEQADNGFSIAQQHDGNNAFATQNGYSIVKTFQDVGKSAGNLDRPALKEMVEYIKSHKNEIDAIIVYQLDRLTRNYENYREILRPLFEKNNIKLLLATGNNDETPEGNLMRNIGIVLAEYDSNLLSKNRSKLSK